AERARRPLRRPRVAGGRVHDDHRPQDRRSGPTGVEGLRVRIEMRAVYLAMTAVLGFGWGLIIPAYAVYYVRTAGLGPLELVLVGTATEASYFLFNVPTGAFADAYGRRRAIVAGAAAVGAGWLFQALVPVFAFILLAEGVRGLGWAFMN